MSDSDVDRRSRDDVDLGSKAGADPSAATVVMPGGPASIDAAPAVLDVEGRATLVVGEVFAGRYAVEKQLGRGGMGVVYLVRDRLVDERIALKLLDMFSSLPDAVEMFRSEVRVSRRITHSNVVRIHALDEHEGRLFLTMEYVAGSDLRREIDEGGGRLDVARAARVGLEVAEALAAAHAIGVVHRDLKPENVLVDPSGKLILTDFGIAKLLDQQLLDRSSAASEVTTRVMGTPAYMAPEQVAGSGVGPGTDLYALGVLLFEAICGRPPFLGDNAISIAVARLNTDPPDIRSLFPVPEPLGSLIMRMLERDPAKRPVSADDVAATLDGYLATLGPDSGRKTAGVAAARAPARTARSTRPGSLAVPFALGRRALAVLPFSYRGDAQHDYLGEALAGELIDVLSRTKGLRVLASGAVARVGDSRDPQKISSELDVDYVVDGSVQTAGEKLRVSVRLVDATGLQLTAARFDLGLSDVFEMQDEAGRRIAEALRLEIVTRSAGAHVPEQVVQLYLRARTILRTQQFLLAYRAADMLEEALKIAPGFAPAVASLALATVYVWFYPQGAPTRDWQAAATTAVEQALLLAPDLAESQVAAARLASHGGRLREAVEAVRRAIELAPTSSDPQYLLGQLECETGRVEEGVARLALAFQIEPALTYPYEAARAAALRGDTAAFDRHIAACIAIEPGLAVTHMKLRHAAWSGDRERLRAVVAEAATLGAPFDAVIALVAKCFLGEADALQAVSVMSPLLGFVNMRFGGLLRQVLVEVHAHAGDIDGALEWLAEAHATILYDKLWLERCPLLDPLRGDPRFIAIASAVTARCDAVWAR